MTIRCRAVPFAIVVLTSSLADAGGPVIFREVREDAGIGTFTPPLGHGTGISAVDYDNDGDVDIFAPNGDGVPNQLYRKDATGGFTEIAALVGLDLLEQSRGGLWLDYDGDADLDLVVATDVFALSATGTALRVYRQDTPMSFVDVTATTGLTVPVTVQAQIGGLVAGDVNNDGYLDVFVSTWRGDPKLFLNDTDGTFTDVSEAAGVVTRTVGLTGWQPLMFDFNGDGWLDIFQCIDFRENYLWMNQGDGTFVNEALAAGVNSAFNEMGAALGDYDNDGDLDLYTTNISLEDVEHGPGFHSILYRNDTPPGGPVAMVDVAAEMGVDHIGWGWGVTFLDADNNGWVDLAVTNGYFSDPWTTDPSMFYLNSAPGAFTDASDAASFNDTEWGSGLAAADFDDNGRIDLVQSCMNDGGIRVMENISTAPAASYLVVVPRQPGTPNYFGIGATVTFTSGSLHGMRYISAGNSLLSQEPSRAHFGLDTLTTVDLVQIDWPDGARTIRTNVPTNQILEIRRCVADLDGDGAVGFDEVLTVISTWGPCPSCPQDIDGSGKVDFTDLIMLLSDWGPC